MFWHFFAQAAPADPGGLVPIIQSTSGWVFLVAAMLTGWLFPKPSMKDKERECELQRERADKERERSDVLQRTVESIIEELKANDEERKLIIHLIESIQKGAQQK